MSTNEKSIYEMIGGTDTLQRLVDVFYGKVEADTSLRAIFPKDLEPGKRWQLLFLVQLFGGPAQYREERGHPRLRMRHAPFPIDAQSGIKWLDHMLSAMDEIGIEEPARSMMRNYFERAASHMINTWNVENSKDV